MTPEPSLWMRKVAEDPGHSGWYVERFRRLRLDGVDISGEARTVDAMLERGSLVLDAGCGGGRVAGYLHAVGHDVVGVDVDPVLVQAAEADYPGPRWVVADLADLDLAAHGIPQRFDAIVCAGNVLTFCAPSTRRDVLDRFAAHLASDGRIVVGFGTDRGYPVAEFLDDVAAVGLVAELLLSTWDLRPYAADADFLVALLRRG
ncbi:MAG: methyltransferase domain-containing protein [Dermatophilaceae bacterium]